MNMLLIMFGSLLLIHGPHKFGRSKKETLREELNRLEIEIDNLIIQISLIDRVLHDAYQQVSKGVDTNTEVSMFAKELYEQAIRSKLKEHSSNTGIDCYIDLQPDKYSSAIIKGKRKTLTKELRTELQKEDELYSRIQGRSKMQVDPWSLPIDFTTTD